MLPKHTTKRCPKCGFTKSTTDFPKSKRAKDGTGSWCKTCSAKASADWAKINPEKVRAKEKRYALSHPEKIKEKDKRNQRKYREANREIVNERSRLWYRCHREAGRKQNQKRRATIKNLLATLTEAQWEDIKAQYGYACAYCGKQWFEIEGVLVQEHVIPVMQGGDYTAENIVPACRKCNLKKGNKTPQQAGMILRTRYAK